MGKWCDLPVELVEIIEDSLILYADKIRIRAVCEYWNARLPKINREFPWLLQSVSDNVEASHSLFSPFDRKFYHLDLRNVLQGKICKGSAHGWVVTVEDTLYNTNKFKRNSNRIYLVNPLTSARIELPSRNKFPDVMKYNPYKVDKEYSVFSTEGDCSSFFPCSSQSMNDKLTGKFVMSSDPSRSDAKGCVIATIYGPSFQLACCTLQNRRWNPLPFIEKNGIKNGMCEDIIFHKGKLHALVGCGGVNQVLVFENINRVKPNPRIKLVARYALDLKDLVPHQPNSNWYTVTEDYLVEHSDGSGLMIIERYIRVTQSDNEDVEIS